MPRIHRVYGFACWCFPLESLTFLKRGNANQLRNGFKQLASWHSGLKPT